MPSWDENSPELHANIKKALLSARDSAKAKEEPSLELPREWQRQIMQGLTPIGPTVDESWYGKFRGESGQEYANIFIDGNYGTEPHLVGKELNEFLTFIRQAVQKFDNEIFWTDEDGNERRGELTPDVVRAILKFMAKVHGEWIRIHPFANGNGRTARLWANWIAMRYGIPPFVALRPRPRGAYESASKASMSGHWKPMIAVFEEMLDDLASDFA